MLNPNVRDSISKLRIKTWVYDFNLNLINKKKLRRINASKYLNKKNINRINRIKILQTIETIKTDFRFEPKLDSNLLSNMPVSLLYYSNLNQERNQQSQSKHVN